MGAAGRLTRLRLGVQRKLSFAFKHHALGVAPKCVPSELPAAWAKRLARSPVRLHRRQARKMNVIESGEWIMRSSNIDSSIIERTNQHRSREAKWHYNQASEGRTNHQRRTNILGKSCPCTSQPVLRCVVLVLCEVPSACARQHLTTADCPRLNQRAEAEKRTKREQASAPSAAASK